MKRSGYKLAFVGLVAVIGAVAANADSDADFQAVCQNSHVVSRFGSSFELCVNAQRDGYRWAQEKRDQMREDYDHCVQSDDSQVYMTGQDGRDWDKISQCMRDRRNSRR